MIPVQGIIMVLAGDMHSSIYTCAKPASDVAHFALLAY